MSSGIGSEVLGGSQLHAGDRYLLGIHTYLGPHAPEVGISPTELSLDSEDFDKV